MLMLAAAAADSPHPRGWTRTALRGDVAFVGFPAPAGMDPHLSVHHGPQSGIPRTRGDGPY